MTGTTPEALYKAYRSRVFRYLLEWTEKWEDAEDLCGDVFVKLCLALPELDEKRAPLSAWVYIAARSSLREYFRRLRPREPLPAELRDRELPEDSSLREEALEKLAADLERMPREERDIVILRYYGGRSLNEIAGLTGMSFGTVKELHQQALARLRGERE